MAANDKTTPTDKGQAEAQPKPNFDVLSNLDHNGKRYPVGGKVYLTDDEAALLPGVVKPLSKAG